MKVEKASTQGDKVELSVEVSQDEMADAAARGATAFLLSSGAAVPEGEHLDTILSQVVGEDGDLEAAKQDFATNYLVPRAVRQADIMPICSPEFTRPSENAGSYHLTIYVYPKPAVELSSYDPVSIEVDAPKVTEEEIDARLAAMAQETAEEKFDIVTASRKVVVPTIDDEWVRVSIPDDSVNTVAELRAALREAGEAYKEAELEQYKLSAASAKMAERLTTELSEDIVDAMARSMAAELTNEVEAQGLSLDDFLKQRRMTRESFAAETVEQARTMLTHGLALDAVFAHEGLEVDDDDWQAALSAIAPGQEDRAEASLVGSGYEFTIEETAQRLKAGKYILEHAHVTVRP